jgi:diguanylate cyclase (GGDEF)-like protein
MVTENFDHDNHYDQQDLSLFVTLASQVAVALENAFLYAQMKELAIIDSLTGIYNRRHFYALASNEVERALRYNKPLAILMIDIDHFKLVNDAYGHAMGDQLLQAVTRQCSLALRKIDIMGRYGGEEFIILLPETGLNEAQQAANRLCEVIAAVEIPSPSGPVKVTASLGLAALNKSLATLEVLLDCADKALYEAKEAGRNQVKIYAHQGRANREGG